MVKKVLLSSRNIAVVGIVLLVSAWAMSTMGSSLFRTVGWLTAVVAVLILLVAWRAQIRRLLGDLNVMLKTQVSQQRSNFKVWRQKSLKHKVRTILGLVLIVLPSIGLYQVLVFPMASSIRLLSTGASMDVPSTWSPNLLVILVIVAVLHWLMVKQATVPPIRAGLYILGAIVVAFGIYHIEQLLEPLFISQFGTVNTSFLPYHIWFNFSILPAITIAIGSRGRISTLWKLIVVGSIGGMVVALMLAAPVVAWGYDTFVPGGGGQATSGNVNTMTANSVIAALLALAIGPIAAGWTRPETKSRRFAVGAVAGSLAGLVLFGLLGAATVSIASSNPLYGFVQSRTGYNSAEWLMKLALSVNGKFLPYYAAFWLPIVGGALVGGITSIITPLRENPTVQKSLSIPGVLFMSLMGSAFLLPLTTLNWSIYGQLGPAVDNIAAQQGIALPFNSDLVLWSAVLQPWIVVTLLQGLALYLVGHHKAELSHPQVALVTCLSSSWCFLLCLVNFLAFVNPSNIGNPMLSWAVLPVSIKHPLGATILITSVLSVEIFLAGWRLWPVNSAQQPEQPLNSFGGIWAEVGVWTGILTGALNFLYIGIAVGLVLIDVAILPEMVRTTAPAPGLEWLLGKLVTVYPTQAAGFVLVMFGCSTVGAVIGAILGSRWFAKARRWAWNGLALRVLNAYHRIVPITASSLRRGVTWLAVAVILDLLFAKAPVFTSLFFIVMVWHWSALERLPLSLMTLAFILTAVGISAYWLGAVPITQLPITAPLLAVVAVVVYRWLMAYTPVETRRRTRLTVLIGLTLLSGLSASIRQPQTITHGGVARFDGQRWQVFNQDNSVVGANLIYHFLEDSEGYLWLAGSRGVAFRGNSKNWESIQVSSDGYGRPAGDTEMWLLEVRPDRYWVANSQGLFGQYNLAHWRNSDKLASPQAPGRMVAATESAPANANVTFNNVVVSFTKPTCNLATVRLWAGSTTEPTDAEKTTYRCLEIKRPITGMAMDKAGNVWIGVDGEGVVRVEGQHPLEDSRWQTFTAENSGLTSNNVSSVYIDKTGMIWIGTDKGLSRYDGTKWEAVRIPETNEKGIRTASIRAILVDSQNGLWIGNTSGSQRFDGQSWTRITEGAPATVFTEGLAGSVWIGTGNGVIRYDLQTRTQEAFNSENSGLAANTVYDLYVDKQGSLWVSTFARIGTQQRRDIILAMLLSVGFFGYLFVQLFRSYQQSPGTRAGRMGRQVAADPNSLYPQTYNVLATTPDGSLVMTRLAQVLEEKQELQAAKSIAALVHLMSNPDLDMALEATAKAFEADQERTWAVSLFEIHRLLRTALAAQRVSDIVALELTVNPGLSAGSIALAARGYTIESVPSFMPKGSVDAWQALERVHVSLRKYQQVDDSGDRLSYLAEALTAVEVAQNKSQAVGLPEGVALLAIANQWRTTIINEINFISGRAELRLELRTRQVRRAEAVTLVLHLQNMGRSAAENVVVQLQLGADITPLSVTSVQLERLPSGHGLPVEFTVQPAAVDSTRIAFEVTWDDRVATGNLAPFGDMVRFFSVEQAFQRIPNPYIVGHPVRAAEMFHGRDDIFQFIADNLSGAHQDRTIVLHGQRRTGKTSLLYQLLNGRLGERFIPVLIDMQELAPMVASTADFLGEIAYQLSRAARKGGVSIETPAIETFTTAPTRTFSRFLDTLEDQLSEVQLVLMIDEFELIEGKIADGKLDDSILGYFRSLIQHRRNFVFIFTGTHRLEEMSHDYWSILFNIALYRQVSFLAPSDAVNLIRKPVAGTLTIDDLAVEKMIALTNGHPYFIQLICWALINECNTKERNYASINDVNDAVQEILTTGEAHFAYIWQRGTHPERLALAGLAHTLRPGKEWARPAEILETLAAYGDSQVHQTGLIKTLDGLVQQETLEVAKEGALRYRFQLEVMRLWVATSKSVVALLEHR